MEEGDIDSILSTIKSASTLLEKKRSDVSKAQEKLNKEREMVKEETLKNANQVKLNVGGTLFRTTISTLTACPDSMFSAMFSGRHELAKDEDGFVFIDRDPTHFRLILNWLRGYSNKKMYIPTLNDREKEELLEEAEFYLFTPLVNAIKARKSKVNLAVDYLESNSDIRGKINDRVANGYELLQYSKDFLIKRGMDNIYFSAYFWKKID